MRIELTHATKHARGAKLVGKLDGEPLWFVERRAVSGGREYAYGEIAEAMVEAVDAAASKVLGPEWGKPLARITGLNPRTCNRDRIQRWGLPPWAYVLLGNAAACHEPRALGHMLLAACILDADGGIEPAGDAGPLPAPPGADGHEASPRRILDHAFRLVSYARLNRALAAAARNAVDDSPEPEPQPSPWPAGA